MARARRSQRFGEGVSHMDIDIDMDMGTFCWCVLLHGRTSHACPRREVLCVHATCGRIEGVLQDLRKQMCKAEYKKLAQPPENATF